jgi:hypothetical protein
MFAKRVHIVPVGEAVERMVSPVIELSADRVSLLVDADGRGGAPGLPTQGPRRRGRARHAVGT